MSSYFSIEYIGNYNNLKEFLKNKDLTYELKNISSNFAYIKIPENLSDDLLFFDNSDLNDSGERISKIQFITEHEYYKPFHRMHMKTDNFEINESLEVKLQEESKFYEMKKIEEICINQDLVLPEFKNILEEVTCTICMQIIWDPKICINCSTPFGKSCLNSTFKDSIIKKCEFENCEILTLLKRITYNIELFCYHKLRGCEKIIKYENFYNHINNCEYGIYRCLYCQEEGDLKFIEKHEYECKLNLITCEICRVSFKHNEIEKHKNNIMECFNNTAKAYKKLRIEFDLIKFQYNKLLNLDKLKTRNLKHYYETKKEEHYYETKNGECCYETKKDPYYERNKEETNCLHIDRLKNICNAVLPANCDKCYKKYLKSYLGCDICDINRCYNCFINYKTK